MKTLFISILTCLAVAASAQKQLNIVFMGNSITQGALIDEPSKYSPPAATARILTDKGYSVSFANCGVSGSTTVDQLPSTNTIFKSIVAAADTMAVKDGQLIFSIMLGTNDSADSGPNGSPVSAKDYGNNLHTIISQLTDRYPACKMVIHYPIWYSKTTQNNAVYLASGLERLQSYTPEINGLADGKQIFVGDTDAFAFFEKNHKPYYTVENGAKGVFYLHPNRDGAQKLAEFWSAAISATL